MSFIRENTRSFITYFKFSIYQDLEDLRTSENAEETKWIPQVTMGEEAAKTIIQVKTMEEPESHNKIYFIQH